MKRTIILMTKSYKHSGRCVAGIDYDTKEWIRLVSDKSGGAVSQYIFDKYNILDLLEVELLSHVPIACQLENYTFNSKAIKKVGRLPLNALLNKQYLSSEKLIFGVKKNKISDVNIYNELEKSLTFVEVDNFSINSQGTKCTFSYNGIPYYNMSLTDPKYRKEGLDGVKLPKALIVVSLPPDDYMGEYYLFVSSVFPLSMESEEIDCERIITQAIQPVSVFKCQMVTLLYNSEIEKHYFSHSNIFEIEKEGYGRCNPCGLFYEKLVNCEEGKKFTFRDEEYTVIERKFKEIIL